MKISKTTCDLIAGSSAGVAGVLSGYPIDTVKVRTQLLGGQIKATLKKIIHNEGLMSFYRGVMAPLLNAPVISAFNFAAYGAMKRILGIQSQNHPAPLSSYLLAGSLTGIGCAAINTPLDFIKCRIQAEGIRNVDKSNGVFGLAYNIIKTSGVKGVFRGFSLSLMRDIPGTAIVFTIYDILKRKISKEYNNCFSLNLLAGGISSFFMWFFIYPQDMMKTRY
jgi:solute carrier family 25 carnitine/acylcarnitine transporter 20/29